MGLASIKQVNIQPDQKHARSTRYQKLLTFLRIWELYPIVFIAAFLRLYRIDAARFSNDPAWIFRMARDAITYGLWPITSNRSTLGSLHPPFGESYTPFDQNNEGWPRNNFPFRRFWCILERAQESSTAVW